MELHEKYLARCLQLALKGQGYVAPNPLVGSVIVHDGKIIGEGYHMKYGSAHAEVNAIRSVQNPSLLASATLYVNLEPCAHFGKTPPCADLITANHIPRVVIGCVDSYSEVAGKGIEKLRAAGTTVVLGVMEKESRDLNRRFFTFHEKKRPYIVLKWAQTADGFIDIKRGPNQKEIAWITEPSTKTLVHRWRHEEAGILVGWKTIATDNPHLTCRDYPGVNPTRLVIDPDLRLDYNAFHVGNRKAKTVVLTKKKVTGDSLLQFINPVDFSIGPLLNTLYELGLQSILVEGGKTTLEQFIQHSLWDEARILTGTKTFGIGEPAPRLTGLKTEDYHFGTDHIQILKHA